MSKNLVRSRIAISAFVAALGLAVLASGGNAGDGQTALSKCIDSVVSACNKKKSDEAIAACFDSGASQCEKQHKAQIQLPEKPRGQMTGFRTQ
jgi:hypothetical protein